MDLFEGGAADLIVGFVNLVNDFLDAFDDLGTEILQKARGSYLRVDVPLRPGDSTPPWRIVGWARMLNMDVTPGRAPPGAPVCELIKGDERLLLQRSVRVRVRSRSWHRPY